MKRLRIPSKLEVQKILDRVPAEFEGFKIDKVHWVCHAIYKGSLSLGKHTYTHPLKREPYYVPLSSESLGHFLGREYYTKIIKWMVAANIIECDNYYRYGIVSKGYRFTEKYRSDFAQLVEVSDKMFRGKGKLPRAIDDSFQESASISALRQWFSGLTIDRQVVMEVVEYMRDSGMKRVRNRKQLLKVVSRYNNACLVVDMFNEDMGDYCHQDAKGKRLHTILTQMPKYMRPFVRYNGKELAQADLSNSQLFFTLFLLDTKNWENDDLFCQVQTLSNTIKTKPTSSYSIMSPAFDLNSPSIKLFRELVSAGKIYDHFVSLMEKQACFFREGLNYDQKRSQIKSLLIAQINGDYSVIDHSARHYDFSRVAMTARQKRVNDKNTSKNLRLYTGRNQILWGAFSSEFPEIAQIYMRIKMNNNADLSHVLQRIESRAILDIACQEAALKRQEMTLFTIHDCVITTVDKIDELNSILKASIGQWIGYQPNSKTKLWSEYEVVPYLTKAA